MKPSRIVFIPVIAVIAGFSIFLSVLLICLDLVAADQAREDEAMAEAKMALFESGDRDAVAQRGLADVPSPKRKSSPEKPSTGGRPPQAEESPKARTLEWSGMPEELRRRVAESQEEIQALHRVGRHEEAENVEADLREWLADIGIEGGGPAADRRSGEVMERQKREVVERQRAEHGDFGERMRHLAEAAEHLQLAGLDKEAEELRHRIQEMERHHHATAEGAQMERLMHRVGELQEAMGKMREDMRRLHEQLEERGGR